MAQTDRQSPGVANEDAVQRVGAAKANELGAQIVHHRIHRVEPRQVEPHRVAFGDAIGEPERSTEHRERIRLGGGRRGLGLHVDRPTAAEVAQVLREGVVKELRMLIGLVCLHIPVVIDDAAVHPADYVA